MASLGGTGMHGLDTLTIVGTALGVASQIALLVVIRRDGAKSILAFLCLWPLSAAYLLAKDPWRTRYPWGLFALGFALDFISYVQHGGWSAR